MKQRMRPVVINCMGRRAVRAALIVLAALGGCRNDSGASSATREQFLALFGRRPAPRSTRGPGPIHFVRLHLRLVELPVGAASGSEQIWSRLQDAPLGSDSQMRLALNGVRLGLARQDNWPQLAKVLERLGGRDVPKFSVVRVRPGPPTPIVIRRCPRQQTIFTFRRDRTLAGADYQPADNLLAVHCALRPPDPRTVMMTVLPQVRSLRRKIKYVKEAEGYGLSRRAVRRSFDSLMFRVRLTEKDLLIIGPGAESQRRSSVGRHFFFRTSAGMEFETLLVLRPEIVEISATPPPEVP